MELLNNCPPFQNKKNIKKVSLKNDYKVFEFSEILLDETSLTKKIKKSDYLSNATYPIIDQGKEDIGGYTNEENALYSKIPCIIFGDHTRSLKYIDYPCFIGADGVKIINLKEQYKDKINVKYLYYYLKYNNIPNDGYSRHFKYLKLLLYAIPSLKTQQKIVEVLDEAQRLIYNRKQQIELLYKLIESVFYDMFGDPIKNEKGWEVKKLSCVCELINGDRSNKYPSAKDIVNEGVLFISSKNIINNALNLEFKQFITHNKFLELGRGKLKKGDLILTLRGSLGNLAIFNSEYETGFINAQLIILRCKNDILNIYLHSVLKSESFKNLFDNISNGAAVQQLTGKQISELKIPIPPLHLQNQFALKVESIEKQKQLLQNSLNLMQENYNCLMQRAFNGELFN